MQIKLGSKSLNVDVRDCGPLMKFKGLMFVRKEKAKALLFSFKDSSRMAIHSLFVFFPFLAVWLDKDNKVLEVKNVRPFTFFVQPKILFYKLVEIPINEKYRNLTKEFVEE